MKSELSRITPPDGASGPLSLLFGALTVTMCSWLVAMQLPAMDTLALEHLAPALDDIGLAAPRVPVASEPVLHTLQLTGLLVVAYGTIATTRKLSPGSHIVALQIYILSCLYQLATYTLLGCPPLLVAYLIACILGACGGHWLKNRDREKKLIESQFYELVMRNRELEEARLALVTKDEVERRLLAADLHDQVLNDLKKIVEAFRKFDAEPSESLRAQIESGFHKSMTEIREIMDDLCPVMLQNFGLGPAIEDCLEKGAERAGFEPTCEIREDEDLERFSHVEQALIFRLVQESITNVCKHAGAENVTVEIGRDSGNRLLIRIDDDGKGIDYSSISHQSRGLRYMRLRADLIDGSVEWQEGRQGKGTSVLIKVPFPPPTKTPEK